MNSRFAHLLLLFAILAGISVAIAQSNSVVSTSTGVVKADRSVTLAAKIIGRIESVKVQEGDRVDQGQVVIDIQDAEVNAELASAMAILSQEEVNLEHMKNLNQRYQRLANQKTVSEDKAEEVAFNYASAKARVRRAKAAVEKVEVLMAETKLRAPFAGVVIEKHAEVGQITAIGAPLLVLEDQSQLKFRTGVKEYDVPNIEIGQKILITIDALNDLQLEGTVSKIIPSGDVSTHEFVVETTLPQTPKLFPGMFGKAEFRH